MRLVDKFTIWFIAITAVVLIAGGLIVFTRVQHEIDREAIRRIKSNIDNIALQLRQGTPVQSLEGDYVTISEIDRALPEIRLNVYDTMAVYRKHMQALDRKLTVEASYHIGEKHYKISMYDFVAEPDEIADGVKKSLAWIFLILLVIVGVTNLIISRRILSPFHQTLKAIRNFSVKNTDGIELPATRTKEFQQLNYFLEKMTHKAHADYLALKEFTENASHELQTPLAVIRGKLELLLESPLTEEQGNQILAALNSIERLSRINHSLTLLNKVENEEFSAFAPIDLSQHLRTILSDLKELIEMKSISLREVITDSVRVMLHPALADILITNLLSNAIRHNIQGGTIEVILTAQALFVTNSGKQPDIPPDQAFERFKRTEDNGDSIGLGLAIVKQICQVSGLTIHYDYGNALHRVRVTFPS